MCRVSRDELNHDRNNMELESIFSAGLLDIKCWECKETFSNKDMFIVADDVDKGLCMECAENDDARIYWVGE
ncbi:unnamed protein product [marine sediment metagenome]|uniref:Uncharacterized protein n=1 Tax=marine sediment metagenome TaxID=412755 RepID=X0TES0_9ZZZZ